MAGVDRLFLELLFITLILMSVMFVNNIFLYKQKVTDFISLMLISGILLSVFEILWAAVDGHPQLRVLANICVCCYCMACAGFGVFINRFLTERLGLRFGKKEIVIGYLVPVALIFLLCVTTPWTKLLFWVDESGTVHTMAFFDYFFQVVVYFYIFSPMLLAIYYLTLGKHRRPADCKISSSLFVFGAMGPALYWMELQVLGDGMGVYETSSLPISLALVYLITNESTHTALDAQAHIEAVETDLRIAAKIQTYALPPVAPEFADHLDLNLRASMDTAREVGGDFYDYFVIDGDRLCFLIADVSGKGTPAALFMMTAKTMIKDYALTHDSPSEIFTAVNARLCENNEAGMFATAWIGILDMQTMTLQYTNAGHNYPLLLRDGVCQIVKKKHGLFLAGMDDTEYRQSELALRPGDRLLLYTDGIPEAHDPTAAMYGEERLMKVVEETADESGEDVLKRITEDVNKFANGAPQFDDMTMAILTIKK